MAAGSDVALSIIIVNWNTRDLLARCLESVRRDVAVLERWNVETFVVDNASRDGSPAMVRERFPWVRLIANEENVGFAAANNQALRQAQGRYVLLLNSDTEVQPGAVAALVEFMAVHPRAGIVGVKLLNPDGTFQAALNDFPSTGMILLEAWGLAKKYSHNPFYPSYSPQRSIYPTSCDWVGGACLLVRAKAISAVGLLDEGYFMYAEEMDWCYRMRRSGWEVWYTPDVEVVHLGGASADRLGARQRMRLYGSKARFVEKYQGSSAALLVRANYRLSSLAKAVTFGAVSLMSGDADNRRRAKAHWQLATTRSWS